MNITSFSNLFGVCLCALALFGCGGSGGSSNEGTGNPDPEPLAETRSFFMGFTPWPYDASIAAVDNTYDLVNQHGDMIAHQLIDGIPWEEAFQETALPTNVEGELNTRVNNTESSRAIYLALDAINFQRDGLANNWGASSNEPLPAPWDTRSFDDQEVIDAYTNFALDMIERFDPEYFSYASEASELLLNDPTGFVEFVVFAEAVYGNIKAAHPDLPILVSVAMKDPSSTNAAAIVAGFASIIDYMDMVGISVYPYVFFDHADRGDPANLPTDWLSQVTDLTDGKPVAITETGWIAESLEILTFGYAEESNTSFQASYVDTLLSAANALDAEFVIWWSLIDYDALWEGVLAEDDVAAIWRDIGLIDPMLNERPGLSSWDTYLSREKD